MRASVERFLAWVGGLDLVVLIASLLVIGGVWAFVEIADEVTEGSTQKVDERIIRALRNPEKTEDPIGPKWMWEVGRDLTALGGVAVLTLMIAAIAGYLCLARKYHAAMLVVGATLGGLLISSALKSAFDRPRPSVVPHLSHVESSSFPSGHSMLSAVVYLTLGALLARMVQRRALKIYFLTVALLLTALVGMSRVYMGVHYPTDVLAGWSAGLVWALVCWLAARYLQLHGAVEPPAAEEEPPRTAAADPDKGGT
jgi:undecaprenyl-diphosphatase